MKKAILVRVKREEVFYLILAQLLGDLLELVLGDEAVVVLVEDLEGHLGLVRGFSTARQGVVALFHLKHLRDDVISILI